MSRSRLLFAVPFLILLGCSDSPESVIDEVADKSKNLAGDARSLAEETAERVNDELGKAREAAAQQVSESVEQFNEQ